jgi:hypothetical protein
VLSVSKLAEVKEGTAKELQLVVLSTRSDKPQQTPAMRQLDALFEQLSELTGNSPDTLKVMLQNRHH